MVHKGPVKVMESRIDVETVLADACLLNRMANVWSSDMFFTHPHLEEIYIHQDESRDEDLSRNDTS